MWRDSVVPKHVARLCLATSSAASRLSQRGSLVTPKHLGGVFAVWPGLGTQRNLHVCRVPRTVAHGKYECENKKKGKKIAVCPKSDTRRTPAHLTAHTLSLSGLSHSLARSPPRRMPRLTPPPLRLPPPLNPGVQAPAGCRPPRPRGPDPRAAAVCPVAAQRLSGAG